MGSALSPSAPQHIKESRAAISACRHSHTSLTPSALSPPRIPPHSEAAEGCEEDRDSSEPYTPFQPRTNPTAPRFPTLQTPPPHPPTTPFTSLLMQSTASPLSETKHSPAAKQSTSLCAKHPSSPFLLMLQAVPSPPAPPNQLRFSPIPHISTYPKNNSQNSPRW